MPRANRETATSAPRKPGATAKPDRPDRPAGGPPAINVDLLKRLCETPGVPGREERVRQLIEQEVRGLFDEVWTDPLGSLICRRGPRPGGNGSRPAARANGTRPTKVLLLCHMDEIGFYVKGIEESGFLRVNNVGGFDTRNLFARRVLVCTRSGDYPAVLTPGGRPVHIASDEDKKKIPEVKEFIVDLGMSAERVRELVRIGDYVVLDEPLIEVGDKVVSKALDNRVACWLGIEAIRRLDASGAGHACELFVAFTVQEEVGLRGAKAASFGVDPDIGVGLDVTLSCDTPGVPCDECVTNQGRGFGLHVMDSSFISDHRLIDDIEAVAEANSIPCQRTILLRGGQDAAAAQLATRGARAVGIVVGTRYIHTVSEMADKTDLAAARDVLAAWLPTIP
ncbi:MAG TPA: M20/M25/M40 family metallo-hydrolase [Phycisphaerales bacterium]|nr:M20/M25/M40 family metallo-hydrolase [Phycisphaerales bacterium]